MAKSDKPRKKHVPKTKQQEKNNCWDELNSLYVSCGELLTTPAPIAMALRDRAVVANCRDAEALKADSKILARDMQSYKESLENIKKGHAGKTGGTENPDELMNSFDMGEQYQQWIMSFQSVVIPTVQSLSDNLLGKPNSVEKV